MPLRLYREDSYLTRFEARVTASSPPADGVISVELDRTAFYPTGGGQPHDTGRIEGLPVMDVREGGDGGVVHVLRGASAPSGRVQGEIDWNRRFDHMQQHTGQHILSRAFLQVAGAATRSFHLGDSLCSIDLDAALDDEARVRRAEGLANDIVFGDGPVDIDQVPASEAPRLQEEMSLLRDLALKPGDPVRLIRIGSFDETPCGGTHVRRTGEVGVVAVRSWERYKGGTRVTFACGGRAVRLLGELGRAVDACVTRLSSPPDELPGAIEHLQDQIGAGKRELKELKASLAELEASALDAGSREVGTWRIVVRELENGTPDHAQAVARRIAGSPGRIALLAARDGRTGKAALVFSRSAGRAPDGLKMGDLLSRVCGARGGKGGGGETFARGGGVPSDQAGEALAEGLDLVTSLIESR